MMRLRVLLHHVNAQALDWAAANAAEHAAKRASAGLAPA